MKKRFVFMAIFVSAFIVSCSNSGNMHHDETPQIESQYIMAHIVDSIISANPDYLDNDIKRKNVANEIQAAVLLAIKEDHNVLTQIPLTYAMMLPKDNRYIVKFELSNVGSSGTRISNKYDIYFNVFTEMTEQEASDLVDNQKYHLTFESVSDVSNNLVLPSGRIFVDNPEVYNFSDDENPHVSPGSFLLKGVKYSK